jgi:hypothetical protein
MKAECIIPKHSSQVSLTLQTIRASSECDLTINLNSLSSLQITKIICNFTNGQKDLYREFASGGRPIHEKIFCKFDEHPTYQLYTYTPTLSVIYNNLRVDVFQIPVEISKSSFNGFEGKMSIRNCQFIDNENDSIFVVAECDNSSNTYNFRLNENLFSPNLNVFNVSNSGHFTPLNSKYSYDGDVIVKGIKKEYEEGFSMWTEDYLKNVSDSKINYYSNLYLTDKRRLSDFIDLKPINYSIPKSFTTTLRNPVSEKLLVFNSGRLVCDYKNKNEGYYSERDFIYEIEFLDDLYLNIKHKHRENFTQGLSSLKYETYYVKYESSLFKFSTNPSDATKFHYVLDKKNNRLHLFYTRTYGTTPLSAVMPTLSNIGLTSDLANFQKYYFEVNYYIQTIEPRINSSWVSYDSRHKNQYEILPIKSRYNLENNFIFSTQYSNVTGNSFDVNLLTLKNQHTHKNYSYRSDNVERNNYEVPLVDARRYHALITGNNEEKGEYSFSGSYEFYNLDYKFECDSYTKFFTPESLYPYEVLNINDSLWHKAGSIAGENPYQSDKVFYRNKRVSGQAEYLCSWLYKTKNGRSLWLDRYYYPEKTPYAEALASAMDSKYQDEIESMLEADLPFEEFYDIPYVHNSIEEEMEAYPQTIKSALMGVSYFDKISDVIFEPDCEYIYFRIGNDYTKEILTTFSQSLIQDGFDAITKQGTKVLYTESLDDIQYVFNSNLYGQVEKYSLINNTHQMTISFWLQSDDWSLDKGYQLMGNYNTNGFSVFFDRKITPLIMVQNGKKVYIYNTDFDLINTVSLQNELELSENSYIKDVYRTDHLDFFETITSELVIS